MKFFHLSDLHIGLKLMNRDLREEQIDILRQITELAQHMALKEAERDCSENRQTRDVHDAE